ncbi:MAG: DNA recombination protein RmuC [Coriobacteriales bacterium]|jgi:DNA recombination protein RmuC|nr:DNA recombination protein RmuC [Coriobacteriales bacterium]
MTIQIVFAVVTVILLAVVIVILLISRRKSDLDQITSLLKSHNDEQRDSISRQLSTGATEQFQRFAVIQESVNKTLQESRTETNERLDSFSKQLDTRLSLIQDQTQNTLQTNREETRKQLQAFSEQVDSRLSSIQQENTKNLDKVNATLEAKVKSLQESNEKRLEQMQNVVDEKLQKTLETRLTQSFELVNKQLDSVQQGLGEMKNLAADARSLKNALTNVKERGTYGEIRLEKLLSDILAPSQYEMNAEIANGKRVEFVIKLPGDGDTPLLLPIDSKFPIEDYNRLLDAEDRQTIEECRKSLALKIKLFAKEIRDKYIVPPKTTDFALMFLPTEGLYAEVVQNVALFEELRDKFKITAVGATTLSAFLSSLQMGFKTLAIEQRSLEVWDTLRSVKSEFVKFEEILDKAHRQIQSADKTLEDIVGKRTRAINRRLRSVEGSIEADNPLLLEAVEADDEDE